MKKMFFLFFLPPNGRGVGWVEIPIGKFQLDFLVFLKPSLMGYGVFIYVLSVMNNVLEFIDEFLTLSWVNFLPVPPQLLL